MSEKSGLADNYGAPPYEDSTTPPPAFSESKEIARPSLHSQLTETRTRRIQNLLAAQIEPLLYSHLLDGIYKEVFLVIPSDILTQQHNLATKDIVGLQDTGNVNVVRLYGDENRAAFWQQPGVLQELASSLRARLAASGYTVEPAANAAAETAQRSQPPLDQPQRQTSPSWLKKQFSTPDPQHDPTATTNYKLGWRSEDEGQARRTLALDEVRVLIKVRDVSFRVETEMGLLDSVTGRVLWLQLEVGT
jgi:hypothetical protein